MINVNSSHATQLKNNNASNEPQAAAATTAVLVLADGRVFRGRGFSATGTALDEVVFTTAMTGYQETLMDPSYHRQLIVATAPQIGNTGWNDEDYESRGNKVWAAGFVIRDLSRIPSNWRSERSLEDELKAQGIIGIRQIDIRALVHHLCDSGSIATSIFSGADAQQPVDKLVEIVRAQPAMKDADLAREVSTDETYVVEAQGEKKARVVVYDLDIKSNTPRELTKRGLEVVVVPANTPYEDIKKEYQSDDVFLSNGPGDPATADETVAVTKAVLDDDMPLFGICLSNQILGRALGLSTYKLVFGRRGVNVPVKDHRTSRIFITIQNHGFALEGKVGESFDTPWGEAEVTHTCLNDDVMEGVTLKNGMAFSVQYHSESVAGPHDAHSLFDGFLELIQKADFNKSATGNSNKQERAKGPNAMPRRTDINHVLVIGSGPIVIGQACEFDYSGTQACRVLREEGLRVMLVNFNPATIMTDPEFADFTYIEPVKTKYIEKILTKEAAEGNPIDTVLVTLGSQTAFNAVIQLDREGTLEKYNVRLIGADIPAIQRGEDRQILKDIVAKIDSESARSRACHNMDEVYEIVAELGLPVVVHPSLTMGGLGSGLAFNQEDPDYIAGGGLAASPEADILTEESILGWKESELELMRDSDDNVIVVCSIENVDALGIHIGDPMTVVPSMILADREFQTIRDQGIATLREVGVDTGGCNTQFAINPSDGRIIAIKMNPRVSRSSALASKTTGFPIAKIAVKLAIGYTLDEITDDITGRTPAAFEPVQNYVIVKAPRFALERFPGTDDTLTTIMKPVGEAMAIGRNHISALGKVMRSLENKPVSSWIVPDEGFAGKCANDVNAVLEDLKRLTEGRIYDIELAQRLGASIEQIHEASGLDPWFIAKMENLQDIHKELIDAPVLTPGLPREAEYWGLSNAQTVALRPELAGEDDVRELRWHLNIHPVFKTVDTCFAEFEAQTPCHYSAYELDPAAESEVAPQTEKEKVIILGSGPNRIGQGTELGHSCVYVTLELSRVGYETAMVNCSPETVSTDYDTADRLYFEPLTFEDILEVYHAENQSGKVTGAIIQLGSQTPLGLAERLQAVGVPIVDTSPEAIDLAEDRGELDKVLAEAKLPAPEFGTATSFEGARQVTVSIGYPVLIRPSYVLGGRGMEIVYDEATLEDYINRATELSNEHPVLVDRFLDSAIGIDVDALCDGEEVYLGGVMKHIGEAGIHSGDSACTLPPVTLSAGIIDRVRESTRALAHGIGVKGLMSVQYALKDETLYIIEANPCASHIVSFVSKAASVPLARAASRVMMGVIIAELREEDMIPSNFDGGPLPADAPIAVKEAVLPFNRFRGFEGRTLDSLLSPEIKSAGEVMDLADNFGAVFVKNELIGFGELPTEGTIFVSLANRDKRTLVFPILTLMDMGFRILAMRGTAGTLRRNSVECEIVTKQTTDSEAPTGERGIVDMIRDGEVDIIINIPSGSAGAHSDGYEIRAAAVGQGITCVTTAQGAVTALQSILALRNGEMSVKALRKLDPAGLAAQEQA